MNNKKKIIGVCGARLFNQIPIQFINTLKEEGLPGDYFIIAFSSNSDDEEETDGYKGENQLYELIKYISFSALVILAETLKNKKIINKIAQTGHDKGIPVFVVDGNVEGCINLNFNYYDGFENMVRHIIEHHGCRKINMLAGFKENNFSEARIEAYKKVLSENGIPFEQERLAYGDFWEKPARKAVEGFLKSGLPFEAIACANEAMAVAACSVLNEHGYNIPEDIIVTGFDGTISSRYHFPVITTCEPDFEGAARFIIDQTDGWGKPGMDNPGNYNINFRTRRSQSCGCEDKTMHEINTVIASLTHDVGDCTWHNIAMGQMLTALIDKKDIMDVVKCIPEHTNLWSQNFRFACFKTDLLEQCKVTETYSRMTTILNVHNNNFGNIGEKFSIEEFMPHLDDVMSADNNVDILIVRQFNSGRSVYGYIAEGYPVLKARALQRCNEFSMFLTHAVDNVIYNFKMTQMNKDLKGLNKNLEEAYNKIAGLYLKDYMTGLYNRRGFYEKIGLMAEQYACKGKYIYIFSIDIDRLKYINDNFGHAEGDFAITTIASAIYNTGGKDSVCARFGGDEFICAVLADTPDAYSAEGFYKELKTNINSTDGINDKEYPVGASAGMCCSSFTNDIDIEDMIRAADKRMYKDKSEHRREYLNNI